MQQNEDKVAEIINWLQEYGHSRINSVLIEERRCLPPYIVLDFGNQGLLGMLVPKSDGGLGFSMSEFFKVLQAISAIDSCIAEFVGHQNILGNFPIMKYARPAIREKYLPLLTRGTILSGLAYSEPGAGSNVNEISSKGVLNADAKGWQLDGAKIWIGNASWSGILNVFVKIKDPKSKREHVTGFSIPQNTPGLIMGAECLTMGMRGMVQNHVLLQGVQVKEDWLLGNLYEGWDVAEETFGLARLTIANGCLALMKRSLQLWLRYASQRKIATGLLLNNTVTSFAMSECVAMVSTLECLIEAVVDDLDRGFFVPKEMHAFCKIVGSEWGWIVVDKAFQGIGGRAYIDTNPLSQVLRDIRIARIFEGPTETLFVYLGASLFRSNPLVFNYIKKRFMAEDIISNLSETLKIIRERTEQATDMFIDKQSGLIWLYMLAADVALYALLWAAVRHASNNSTSEHLKKVAFWASVQYQAKRKSAIEGGIIESVVHTPDELKGLIGSYVDTIGDEIQTLAGADYSIDPIFKNGKNT